MLILVVMHYNLNLVMKITLLRNKVARYNVMSIVSFVIFFSSFTQSSAADDCLYQRLDEVSDFLCTLSLRQVILSHFCQLQPRNVK